MRHPKRLRQVHAYLRKQALALQKSVFAIETDPGHLAEVQVELRSRADPREDDLRLSPIPGLGAVWTAGRQAERMEGMYSVGAGARAGQGAGTRVGRWFKGLFGREAA